VAHPASEKSQPKSSPKWALGSFWWRETNRAARGPWRSFERAAPNLGHRVHYADLTRISEIKRVATEIAEAEPRIDVLINNAGAMFANRKLTEDGLEFTFALNHMAWIARAPRGLGTGSGRQHRIGRASGRFVGMRRFAIDGKLRRHESLWSFQALQHSLHA
jgi:NAD(P)-dependent dehydrogenase (short-subunit alcohol dehydrogenase family)